MTLLYSDRENSGLFNIYMTCKAGVLMSHYRLIIAIRLDFNLQNRLFIGLHHLRVYHRWKGRINLYNI